MTLDEWGLLVQVIIAIGVGATALFGYLSYRLHSRRSLQVEIDDLPSSPKDSRKFTLMGAEFAVKAKNDGSKVITLTEWGLYVPECVGSFPSVSHRNFIPLSHNFYEYGLPKKLSPEKSFTLKEELHQIDTYLRSQGYFDTVKLVAYFRDSIDRNYFSKPYKYIISNELS